MNIIDAIINLLQNDNAIRNYQYGNNRANNMGKALEEYIVDLFAGTSNQRDDNKRNSAINKAFSYLGNQNNPPDSMLRGGDAIEVKKLESKSGELALNSSYPKHKLFSNSSRITDACRNAEDPLGWTEKDIIYTVGYINGGKIKRLFFVYGCDYAASRDVYTSLFIGLQKRIREIPNYKFSVSKELGRVPSVDPLGITYLRIRGMWHIKNPWDVFTYVYKPDDSCDFNFACLINIEKWEEFNNTSALLSLEKRDASLNISDVEIKDPDNPASLNRAKLITITRR